MIQITKKKILLKNTVIDYGSFHIRKKTKNSQLESLYDEFLEHAYKVEENFKDKQQFYKSLEEIADEKRPLLIARDIKVPFLSTFRKGFRDNRLINPLKKRLNDKYFSISHIIYRPENPGKILNKEFCKDLNKK